MPSFALPPDCCVGSFFLFDISIRNDLNMRKTIVFLYWIQEEKDCKRERERDLFKWYIKNVRKIRWWWKEAEKDQKDTKEIGGEGENLNSNDWLFGRRECWDVILLLFCLREEEIQSHVLISTFVVLERTSHNYNWSEKCDEIESIESGVIIINDSIYLEGNKYIIIVKCKRNRNRRQYIGLEWLIVSFVFVLFVFCSFSLW